MPSRFSELTSDSLLMDIIIAVASMLLAWLGRRKVGSIYRTLAGIHALKSQNESLKLELEISEEKFKAADEKASYFQDLYKDLTEAAEMARTAATSPDTWRVKIKNSSEGVRKLSIGSVELPIDPESSSSIHPEKTEFDADFSI